MKKIISLFLSVMLLNMCVPAIFISADEGNTSGGTLTWTFENGVLTLSGTGTMDIKSEKLQPWNHLLNDIEKIVIEEGVTQIPPFAFCECTNLTSVKIASTVNQIGKAAFSKCTGLRWINIPEGVERIDHYAFYNCRKMSLPDLPSSLKSIGIAAFHSARFAEIELPENLEEIESEAFAQSHLRTITLPDSVKKIGTEAFVGCRYAEKINLGNGVEEIGDKAFF